MAGGYGPPLLDFSPLGQLGKTFSDSYDEAEASKLLGRLMGSDGPRAPQPRSMSPLGASLVQSSTQQPVAENETDTQRMEASMMPGYNADGRAPSFTGQPVQAASIIKSFEGYREKPYWDVNAHRVGYGSDTITDPNTGQVRQVQQGDRIDRSQAEADLARRVPEFQQRATQQAPSFARLPENVKAALTSVVYNYGSLPRTVAAAVETGDANAIASAVEGLGDHNGGVNRDRRMKEAAIIRGNPADLPAPGAQNAQGFAIPQGGGAPAAQDPEQRAMMGALLRNKHTRQVGLALWSDMRKGADVKMQDLGGAIGVFDSQGNLLRQIPKTGAEKWSRLNDGTLYNAATGETKAAGDQQQGGPFRGNAVDAQALNFLVQNGQLTAQQAAEVAAGKQITGPDGQILFMTPSAIMAGQGGGQQPQGQPAQPGAPGAPQQRQGVSELTAPRPVKPTDKMRSDLAMAERTSAGLKTELQRLKTMVGDSGSEFLPTADKARMQTVFTNVQMQLKNLYELGAITGPDMAILGQLITDPTGNPLDPRDWGKGLNIVARNAAQVDEFERIIDTSLQNARSAMGGSRADGLATPQANAGAPAPGTVMDGYRFKGGNPGDPSSWERM
jgi:GH24 family phage-related lysozyme (muramidase)